MNYPQPNLTTFLYAVAIPGAYEQVGGPYSASSQEPLNSTERGLNVARPS